MLKALWGGDLRFPIITIFAILIKLNAIELSELPNYTEGEFKITQNYDEIINSKNLTRSNVINIGDGHQGAAIIGSFINYGIISWSGSTKKLFMGVNSSGITNFYNYGIIDGYLETNIWSGQAGDLGYDIKNLYNYGTMGHLYSARAAVSATNVYNYGTMGGLGANSQKTFILDNRGIIEFKLGTKYHFENINLVITNYSMIINKDADSFNSFDGQNANDNSHIVFSGTSSNVSFKDSSSKIILDFGNKVEMGKGYLLSQLLKTTNNTTALNVDFSRLTTRSELYTLTQSGDNFIVNLVDSKTAGYSTIGILHKSNIRTMNNFYTMSNALIYPRKSYHSQNLGKKNLSLRASEYERGNPPIKESLDSALDSTLDSAIPLKSYESFAYRNEAQNRRIQRQNKRNYNRKTNNAESSVKSQSRLPRATSRTRNDDSFIDSANETNKTNQHNLRDSANQQSSSLRADSQNLRGNPQNQSTSQNLAQNPHNYYFILTPFFNYNSFAQSGNYNLSGFDYGFLTAFSATIAESNNTTSYLGTHFIFSYGKLGDSKDKDLSIKTLNLNIGLNYKLDLIWDMYIKARGDFFYFLNAIDSLTIKNIKPNNIGFGVSVAYGKDFDFKSGGVLGLEVGLDYKALQSSTISLQNNASKSTSETYNKALYNLIYADLGLNYNKYFGNFGLNATLGIKGNITANKLAKSKIYISTFNKNIDLTLDNDMFLGYANLGASYVLNTKNFDMGFSLAYYGNFGDRGMSNGGGFEWRVEF